MKRLFKVKISPSQGSIPG